MSQEERDDINRTHAEAERIAEEETAWRHPSGLARFAIPVVAIAWSLFQIYIAIPFPNTEFFHRFHALETTYIRAIHLAFALLLIFLGRPFLKRPWFGLKWLAARDRLSIVDGLLGVLAAVSALYLVINHANIVSRLGDPTKTDLIFGLMLIVLLLEGCRRSLGPALSIVAITFCLYAFFAESMPELMAFKDVSLRRFVGQMTMGLEGVYGTPLYVSAHIVFLFVLFGAMLERAGGGLFFTQLALSLLGGYRGGPAKAAVLSSGLTGMVSGSSIANIVTTGTFTIPMMKKVGYPPTKAAAIEVAASTDGQLAPPIMGAAAFIIAEIVGVSYIDVIKAAAIPAFASYAALLYITHVEACKLGLRRIPRNELPPFWKTLLGGLHFLIPLGFLLTLLIVLRRSPEQSAFVACCVMAVVMIAQRPVQALWRKRRVLPSLKEGAEDFLVSLANGGRNMVSVALATAGAGIIVGVVSLGPGGIIPEVVNTISMGSIFLMLLITAVACLIIGMGLPTTATYVTMATLTAPVIVMVGGMHDMVVPLMAAHLFVFYFGILADDTPPVGLAAYTAAAIAKSPPVPTGIQGFLYDIRTAILPFMFIFNADLILHNITSWPFGLLIFTMACVGNCAFVAATQGWFATRMRWYELPFLLSVTLIMFRPDVIAQLLSVPHDQRYWTGLIGLSIFVGVYMWQRYRDRRSPTPATI